MSSSSKFFDEYDLATEAKLNILRSFLDVWLSIMLKTKIEPKALNIYDFFAGEGKDRTGKEGSPLIISSLLNNYRDSINKRKIQVKVVLNEKVAQRFSKLKTNLSQINFGSSKLELKNLEFIDLLNSSLEELKLKGSYNFLFLDPFGVKEINEKAFDLITSLERTDSIFFISSSFFIRFKEHGLAILGVEPERFANLKPEEVTKEVKELYQKKVPQTVEYYMGEFTLKKERGNNVYGLIFGSRNILGLEKFNYACWKEHQGGSINRNQEELKQLSLFELPSISDFEQNLKNLILQKSLTTNIKIYYYTVEEGFLPKHANKVIKELYKNGFIEKTKAISYQNNKTVETIIVKSNP